MSLKQRYAYCGQIGDKVIIPFNTHFGSLDGGTYETIRQLAPKATVLEGLSVEMQEMLERNDFFTHDHAVHYQKEGGKAYGKKSFA